MSVFAPTNPPTDLLGIPLSLPQLVGNTPLIRLKGIEEDFHLNSPLYAKLELMNPGGSVKDRIGVYMVQDALRRGMIRKHTVVIEPTSGNTGMGLAIALAGLGNPLITVMPDKMSREKELLLKAMGATVIRTPTAVPPEHPLSYYSVTLALAKRFWAMRTPPTPRSVREVTEEIRSLIAKREEGELRSILETPVGPNTNAWIPDQYHNPANPRAHEETTGPEIWEQTRGTVEILVAGMGTGGTITGVARYLKKMKPRVRIVGVDPEGSVYYYLKQGLSLGEAQARARPYRIEGIGEDILPTTIDLSLVDEVIRVTDQQAFSMARYLGRRERILAGSSSGAALYAAVKLLSTRGYRAAVTVVILPDTGRSYLSKFYDDDWMTSNGFTTDDERVLGEIGLER